MLQLNHLPDLDIQTYRARYGNDARAKVFERQREFLTLIHELGCYGPASEGNGSVFALRYDYDPQRTPDALQISLAVNNHTGLAEDKLRFTLLNSPLGEFYRSWRSQPPAPDFSRFRCCALLQKEEALLTPLFKTFEQQALEQAQAGISGLTEDEVREQFSQLANNPFYFIPLYVPYRLEAVADNDMLFLDRLFAAHGCPLVVEVCLRPLRPGNEQVRAVERMLNHLERIKDFSLREPSSRDRISLRGDLQDLSAAAVAEIFESYHEDMLSERHFEFAIRVWAEDATDAIVVADQLAVNANASGKYRKLLVREDMPEFDHLRACARDLTIDDIANTAVWDDTWAAPFHEADVYASNATGKPFGLAKRQHFGFLWSLHRLGRITTLDNIAAFFRLPVPGSEPLQTISKETEIRVGEGDEQRAIRLGRNAQKTAVAQSLMLDQLTKHMFISGVPGSGKTTAIFNILCQLHQQGIPFLVFEPAKTEYRLLKRLKAAENQPRDPQGRGLGDVLQVYTLGQEHLSPLRFNPLEFPQGVTLNEHLSALEACFRGAMPISTGPLPALINEAVDAVYAKEHWQGTQDNQGERDYPSLTGLYQEVRAVFETKQYSGDVRGDLQTAIEVRLGTLLRRSIGKLFDTPRSLPDIATLMGTPCIIELDALNEEQSNLMIMFLLAQIRAQVRANRASKSPLAHVIVLEEAHNIIGKAEQDSEEGGNPKAEATKYITQFLAEVRALGQGMIIADQLPSAVAPEVVKNTNIKLAHRLVAADDREELGLSMLADPAQFEAMARLLPGEALLYREGMFKPVHIQGDNIAERYPVLGEPPPQGPELKALIHDDIWHQKVSEQIQQQALQDLLGE